MVERQHLKHVLQ